MIEIKEYIKANSTLLFKHSESNSLHAIFDKKGFEFTKDAEIKYKQIKNKPHVYVAWTEGFLGYCYIGKSNQPGGRWKKSHAYHLGTLAHQLFDNLQSDDQNHGHWIAHWMKSDTMTKISEKNYSIELRSQVFICFIPFEIYLNRYSDLLNSQDLSLQEIKNINTNFELELIQFFKNEKINLLNVQNNKTKKSRIALSTKIRNTNFSDKIVGVVSNTDAGEQISVSRYCKDFFVKQKELAADIADKTIGLPKGKVSIDIFDVETEDRLYSSHRAGGTRITKLKVSEFFRNQDTKAQPNRAKQVVLQEEMITRKVKEVRVIVCPIIDIDKPQKSALPTKNSPIVISSKSTKTVKTSSQKLNKSSDIAIENKSEIAKLKIKKVIKSIDFDKLKSKKKLLIISCSSKKVEGGDMNYVQNYFLQNNAENLYNDLVNERHHRMGEYVELLNEQPDFFENHGGADVQMLNLNNGQNLPAIDRYSGRFYNQELRNLYNDKNLNSNLHVLIISGLYGVISFQDTIINYHLMIDNPNAIWGGEDNLTLRNTVQQYMHDNKIKEKNVFYAVSPSTYEDALKPMPEWTDLWIDVPNARNGNNAYSAQCVRAFLENL
jgi:cytoplasmic iron level regulating protein YaaA (DUF328/UPF0246 family)